MFTVMRMTLREFYRKKVLVLAVVLSLVFLGFYAFGLHMAARDFAVNPNPLIEAGVYATMLVLGIYLSSFLINFLAVFLSAGAISSEIETGTIQALVATPIKRKEIVLGKFLGYGLGIAAFSLVFITAILLLNRWTTGFYSSQAVWGAALFCAQPIILLGVSLLGSCWFPTLGNGVGVLMLYLVGIVGGIVEQVGAFIKNPDLINTGIITSLVMPVDSLYRKSVEMFLSGSDSPLQGMVPLGPLGSQSSPSQWMLLYALLYLVVFVWGSAAVFNRKDLG